jgi:hypothetical protein
MLQLSPGAVLVQLHGFVLAGALGQIPGQPAAATCSACCYLLDIEQTKP